MSIYKLFGFTQIISDATRVTLSPSTLIDHIATNNNSNISCSEVLKSAFDDHCMVFCARKLRGAFKRPFTWGAKGYSTAVSTHSAMKCFPFTWDFISGWIREISFRGKGMYYLGPYHAWQFSNQNNAASIKILECIISLSYIIAVLTCCLKKALWSRVNTHHAISACLHVNFTPDMKSHSGQNDRHEIRPATRFHFGLRM